MKKTRKITTAAFLAGVTTLAVTLPAPVLAARDVGGTSQSAGGASVAAAAPERPWTDLSD